MLARAAYRYFCWGVVLTSISWCFVLLLYTQRLETIGKETLREQRRKIQAESGQKVQENVPFPDAPNFKGLGGNFEHPAVQRGPKVRDEHEHMHLVKKSEHLSEDVRKLNDIDNRKIVKDENMES